MGSLMLRFQMLVITRIWCRSKSGTQTKHSRLQKR